MATIADLKVNLLADSTGLNKSLADATANLESFGRKMTDIGSMMSTRLTLPIMAMGGAMVKAFTVQEDAVARMTAGLRANGGQANITAGEIQELAKSLQNVTTFGDEATISASALLLTFHKVRNEMGKGNDIFNRTIKASQDLASALGIDLQSATMQLAKALENPTIGISALARSGTTFTEQQKEMIKTLVESGRQLEAQAMVLDVVESQYKGTAETMATTVSGQIKQAFNAFGDQMEEFGKIVSQDFVIPILKGVGKVVEMMSRLDEGTRKTIVLIAGLTAVVGPLLLVVGKLTTSMIALTTAMMANPFIALGGAILAIGTYAVFASGALDSMNSKILRALKISADTLGTEEARNKLFDDQARLTGEIAKRENEIAEARKKFGNTLAGAQYISGLSIGLEKLKAQLEETKSLVKESEKLANVTAPTRTDAPAVDVSAINHATGSIDALNERLELLTAQFNATNDASQRMDLARKINDAKTEVEALQSVLKSVAVDIGFIDQLMSEAMPIGSIVGSTGELLALPMTLGQVNSALREYNMLLEGANTQEQRNRLLANIRLLNEMRDGYMGVKEVATPAMKEVTLQMAVAQQMAMSFTDSFGAGMANIVVQGEKLMDVLKNIGKLLLSSAIQTGIKLLLMGSGGFGVTGGFGGLLGGLFSPQIASVPTQVMGAGVMSIDGQFKVQGTDLIAVINRSERQLR